MTKNNSRLKSVYVAALTTTTLLSAPVFADQASIDITSISVKNLTVESNGSSYIFSPTPSLTVNARMELDAGFSGRIKSWRAWPSIIGKNFGGAVKTDYKEYGASKTYSSGDRPKRASRNFSFLIPGNRLGDLARNYCNTIRQNYMTGGKTAEWVLSQDREYDLLVDAEMNYDMSGISGTNFIGPGTPHSDRSIRVTCQKYTPKAATNQVAAVPGTLPEVTQVSAAVFPEAALDGSYCRVRISGAITSNKMNMPLTYRYGYSDFDSDTPIRYSAPVSVSTSHSKTVMVSDVFDVPVVEGKERGTVWIEAVSPNSLQSKAQNYEMNCAKKLTVQARKPIKKTVTFAPNKRQNIGGQSCPVSGHIVVVLKGSGEGFEGEGRVTVRNKFGDTHSSGNHNVSLSPTGNAIFGMPYALKWGSNSPTFVNPNNGGDAKTQTLKYRVALQRDGETNTSTPVEKELKVECSMIAQNQAGPSSSTTFANQNAAVPTTPTPKAAIAAVTLLPDLTIQKVQQTGKQRVKVLVVNQGAIKSKPSKVSFVAGKGNLVTRPVPGLTKGQKKWITLRLPKLAKSARVHVDPKNQVKESKEGNNKKTHTFK